MCARPVHGLNFEFWGFGLNLSIQIFGCEGSILNQRIIHKPCQPGQTQKGMLHDSCVTLNRTSPNAHGTSSPLRSQVPPRHSPFYLGHIAVKPLVSKPVSQLVVTWSPIFLQEWGLLIGIPKNVDPNSWNPPHHSRSKDLRIISLPETCTMIALTLYQNT